MAGAKPDFTGWQYSNAATNNWVWNFVIADNATKDVVFYGSAGGNQWTQAAIASQPDVISYSATFSLPTTETLDFMIRDWGLSDNSAGVVLDIAPFSTPKSWISFVNGNWNDSNNWTGGVPNGVCERLHSMSRPRRD